MDALTRYRPQILSILRIMAGLLVMQHGTTKLLHFPEMQMSGVAILSLVGIAGVIELVGGALVVVGYKTRIAAFLLSGMTAVAYFMVHAPSSYFPIVNGGELVALYSFVFLYIAAAGPGPISIDRR